MMLLPIVIVMAGAGRLGCWACSPWAVLQRIGIRRRRSRNATLIAAAMLVVLSGVSSACCERRLRRRFSR